MNGSIDWGNQTAGVQDHGMLFVWSIFSQCFKEGGKYCVILPIAIPSKKVIRSQEPSLQTGQSDVGLYCDMLDEFLAPSSLLKHASWPDV